MIDKETRIRGKLKIKFELVDDDITSTLDTDVYGTLQSYRTEDALSRKRNGYPERGEEWYVPSQTVKDLVTYYQKNGDSKGSAYMRAAEARRTELQDFEDRYEGDNYYSAGLIVKVVYNGKVYGESSLWGIDLSVYSSNNEDYIREVSIDVLSEATNEALKRALRIMDADAVARLDILNKGIKKLLARRYTESWRNEYIRKITAWRKGMINWRYKSLMAGEAVDHSRVSGRRISLSA